MTLMHQQSPYDLTGRTAIVTGSSTGNGRAIAISLAQAGVNIIGVDLNPGQVNGFKEHEPQTIDLVRDSFHVKSAFVQGDVSKEETWERVVAAAIALDGRIDILVNNAGILGKVGPLHECTLAQWNLILNINLTAVFLGVRAVVPTMLAQKQREGCTRGTVITISSNAAHHGAPDKAPYCATKGALVALNRALAVDYGRQGIKCITVSPGIIATALNAHELADPTKCVNYRAQTPWPRFGRVDEVGSAVLFLASDASDYCNGSDFSMDAGYNVA